MRNSDVVSLHARLTSESYHLIGENELAMMKPTAVLVNTARSGMKEAGLTGLQWISTLYQVLRRLPFE